MSNETKIGLLTLVTIVVAIWGFKFLKGKNLLSSSNFIYAEYDNIDYLQLSSPVIINGFQVGIVSNIYLKPEDLKKIVVELDIRKDIQIPKETIAQIIPNGLLGEKAINLNYDKPCSGVTCAESGTTIKGATVGMVESMLGTEDMGKYMDEVRIGMTGIYKDISKDISDPNSDNVMAKSFQDLSASLANLKEATNQLNQLLSSSSGRMTQVLGNLESISGNLASRDKEINNILANASTFTDNLKTLDVGKTVDEMNSTFTSTGEAVEQLKTTLGTADKTVKELSTVLGKINEGDGTISMLMNDKELYTRLNESTKNLDLLLEDVRLNPRRYLKSIFVGRKKIPYEAPAEETGSLVPKNTGG